MIENLRLELADLNDELANGFIHEYGVPVCDFKVNHIHEEDTGSHLLKQKFKD